MVFFTNLKRNFCRQSVEDLVLHCLPMSHKKDASLWTVKNIVIKCIRPKKISVFRITGLKKAHIFYAF